MADTVLRPLRAETNNDRLLRARVREVLQAGHVPRRAPDKLFGGFAAGDSCAVCGAVTASGEVVLELEFNVDSEGRRTYQVHPHCFSILSLELQDG